jgi:hypothetical protein
MFEELSRTTAGEDDGRDSYDSSTGYSPMDRMYEDFHRTKQEEHSMYMRTQEEYGNSKKVGNGVQMYRENAMPSSSSKGKGKGTPDYSYGELFEWASKYARADKDAYEEAEPQKDALRLRQMPPAHTADGHHRDMMYVFEKYICKREEDHGVTIMLHDVPYRFQVEPDVLKMIETVGNIDAVDYIYLPMAVDRPTAYQFRNKGYCFIHFWDPVAAQSFVSKIYDYKVPDTYSIYDDERPRAPGKGIFAVMAKFQGLALNLNNLLDIHSKKWRPKNGCAYVRTDSGLSCVRLLALRNLAKQYVQLCNETFQK